MLTNSFGMSRKRPLGTDKENVWTQWFFKDFNGRQRVESKAEKNYLARPKKTNKPNNINLPWIKSLENFKYNIKN